MEIPPIAYVISIPAFREEGDLSTVFPGSYIEISIPAFREEGDTHARHPVRDCDDFNPRLP